MAAKIVTLETAGARLNLGDLTSASLGRPEAREAFRNFLRGGDPAAMMQFVRPENASTMVGPNTGWLVPQEISQQIEKLERDYSPLRKWARIDFLAKDRSATSGWVGESDPRNPTSPDLLDKVAIPLGEIFANVPMTQRMLDDAPDIADGYVMETIADQFAQQEGAAFMNGDGVNKPRGLLTYPTATTTDFTRAFGTIQYRPTTVSGAFEAAPNSGNCLVNLVADLRPRYRQGPNVAWLMSSSTQAAVRLLKDSQGRPLYVPGLLETEPDRLLGYPVAIDENMPAIAANSLSIAFGAWNRCYIIADHQVGTRVLRDMYTSKPNILFYATKRVGAALYNSEAVKFLKFSVA
jgi:HK97 family phage major capsid protein